jgi:hypothetical protein
VIERLRAAGIGAWAAWRTAARVDADLGELLEEPAMLQKDRPARGAALTGSSLRDARRALRLLAALPGRRWRNTCLYRSVAECAVLRRYGLPARVCLGVRRDAVAAAAGPEHACDIRAHAWVEVEDADQLRSGARPNDVAKLAVPGADSQRATE